MATLFEDSAEQFGVASQDEADEEIYAPVSLSNSTRRYGSVKDKIVDNMMQSSARTRIEQDQLARRLEIDKMQDEEFNREIAKRVNAAAWNDKVRAQKQAGEVSQALIDLDPTAPDYLMQVDTILKDKPLARANEQIAQLLAGRGEVAALSQKERERQQMLTDRNQERMDAREDNQQFQMDSARIAREENLRTNIDLKVSDMSAEGQNTYKRLLGEGKTPMEAFQAARIDDKGVVNLKEANLANRMVQNYDRQITQAQKAMAEIDADLMSTPEVKAARKSQFEAQIQDWQTAREMEAAVLDAYWESKGGRPKPKQDDAAPKPTPTGKMSVKSLLPGSK